MLQNDSIRLRAPEPEDIDILFQWENDVSLWVLSESTVPISKHLLVEYIQSAQTDIFSAGQLRLIIESIKEPGKRLGAVDIFDFDSRNLRAGLGILIDKTQREKGYASQALRLTIQYCFEHLGLHQLYCNIQKNHLESLRLFQNKGFQLVGLKKDWLRVGHEFEDVFLLQRIYSTSS